jgi:hypothetical protein
MQIGFRVRQDGNKKISASAWERRFFAFVLHSKSENVDASIK